MRMCVGSRRLKLQQKNTLEPFDGEPPDSSARARARVSKNDDSRRSTGERLAVQTVAASRHRSQQLSGRAPTYTTFASQQRDDTFDILVAARLLQITKTKILTDNCRPPLAAKRAGVFAACRRNSRIFLSVVWT